MFEYHLQALYGIINLFYAFFVQWSIIAKGPAKGPNKVSDMNTLVDKLVHESMV